MSSDAQKPAVFSECNAADLKEWLAQGNGECLSEGTPLEIKKRIEEEKKKKNTLSDQPAKAKKVVKAKKKKLSMIEK